jgi:hypothetical protein
MSHSSTFYSSKQSTIHYPKRNAFNAADRYSKQVANDAALDVPKLSTNLKTHNSSFL